VRRALLAATPIAALWLAAAPAQAQLGLSASLGSDFRYRGFSLSDGKPALSVTANYDHPAGGYLNAAAIVADTADKGVQALGYQAYAGWAWRLDPDTSWDLGVTHSDLTDYLRPRYRARYSEAYAGFSWRGASAHLYYSPDYLGEGGDTLYGSLDGSLVPRTDWRLFGHLGVLAPVRTNANSDFRDPQIDLRAGVARRIAAWELQLAVTGVGPNANYPAGHAQSHEALVVSVSRAF